MLAQAVVEPGARMHGPNWDDDDLHALHQITGADFEAIDTSTLRNGP